MINKVLNIETYNFIWLYFLRKVCRFYKIYFVPSNKKRLPKNNHPLINLTFFFDNQYFNYTKGNRKYSLDVYYVLKKYFKRNAKIKFLDYGGENLDLYLYLQEKYPKIEIIVINQAKLVVYFKNFIKKKKIKNIKIINNINKIKNLKFDFVNFGSSLQYIKNYEKILNIVIKKASKYIYISASSFFYSRVNLEKIIVKQVNLLPVIMYCYIFNLNFIVKLFKKNNYKVLKKKNNSFKKINFKNFNFKIDHLNILFEKNIKRYIYQPDI